MNIRKAAVAIVAAALLGPVAVPGQSPARPDKYDKWLNEEVVHIIAPAEREVFGALTTDRDRDLFVEEFWRQRDPTPGTPANEIRTEHYRRLAFVNTRFNAAGAVKGWKTDRGRALIILGQPLNVQRFASADTSPLEVWYYVTEVGWDLPTYFRLLFFQEYGADEFALYDPGKDGPKRLVPFPDRWRPGKNIVPGEAASSKPDPPAHWTAEDRRAYQVLATYVTSEAAEASVSCFPGFAEPGDAARSSELIRGLAALAAARIDESYARGFLNGRAPAAAEVNYSLHAVECRSRLTALEDGSGGFRVDYALGPRAVAFDRFGDRSFAGLRTTIRAKGADGKTTFEDVRFTPVELSGTELEAVSERSPEIRGSFALGPGPATVDILFEDTVGKRFASVTRAIAIPPGSQAAEPEPEKPARGTWIINQ